jgi:hypothetical protein
MTAGQSHQQAILSRDPFDMVSGHSPQAARQDGLTASCFVKHGRSMLFRDEIVASPRTNCGGIRGSRNTKTISAAGQEMADTTLYRPDVESWWSKPRGQMPLP